MDAKYINPFLSSIKSVFDMMLGIEVNLGKPHRKEEDASRFDVSGIIGLTGVVTGTIVINMTEELALKLSSALCCEEITELNDDCIDAIGELANMITGGAKKDYPGDSNCISVPSVVLGRHKVCYPKDTPIISIPCQVEGSEFIVDVALAEVAVPA